jgi:hypothetical protein
MTSNLTEDEELAIAESMGDCATIKLLEEFLRNDPAKLQEAIKTFSADLIEAASIVKNER